MRAAAVAMVLAASLLAMPAGGMQIPPPPGPPPDGVDIAALIAEWAALPEPRNEEVYQYVLDQATGAPPNYHPLFDVLIDHRHRPPGNTQDVVIPPAPEPRWAHTAAPELIPGPAPGWAPPDAAPSDDAGADTQVVWVAPVEASLAWLWGVALLFGWVTFLVVGVVRDVRMARSVEDGNVPVIR